MYQGLIAPIIAVCCLGGVIASQQNTLQLTATQTSKNEYLRLEKAEKTNINLLRKAPALGFSNLVANWAFLKFIQYYGDSAAREQMGYALVPEYFEVIVNRDPRFVPAYLYLSTASSLFAGRPDRTVALMNQGLESLSPRDHRLGYYVWLYKGVDELLFLGQISAARHSNETAANWATIQGDTATAARARETAQFLAQNPDSRRAQVSAWMIILGNAQDQRVRQRALAEIQSLGGQVVFERQGNATILKVKVPQTD